MHTLKLYYNNIIYLVASRSGSGPLRAIPPPSNTPKRGLTNRGDRVVHHRHHRKPPPLPTPPPLRHHHITTASTVQTTHNSKRIYTYTYILNDTDRQKNQNHYVWVMVRGGGQLRPWPIWCRTSSRLSIIYNTMYHII